MTSSAINDYLELEGSTTRFLQRLSGQAVVANVHLQTVLNRGQLIERISTLHVGGSEPILAAKCLLNLADLTEHEVSRLTNSTDPIGGILLASGGEDLRREKLLLKRVARNPLADFLSANAVAYHVKSFELWQEDRFIGDLEETVCAESFARVETGKVIPSAKSKAV